MTETQKQIVLLLAEVYLDLGRPRRCLMLLHALAREDRNDIAMCRLALKAHLALGNFVFANDLVDRLVEHEFSSRELAQALSMQCQALTGLNRPEAARAAWSECVALCRTANLDPMEYAA